MDATLYCQFTTPTQLQECLYYFDPATSLPFADEVEPEAQPSPHMSEAWRGF